MSDTDKLKCELYDEVVNEKNKQYIELSCRYRETCNDIKKKDKEIERLNNIINKKEQFLGDNIKRLEREVVKRDNIINELEHDFESYELEYLQDTYQGSLADFIETELERIQELKGSESNE